MKIKCLIKIIYGKWRDAFSVALGREIDDETRNGNKRKTPLSVCFNLESPRWSSNDDKVVVFGREVINQLIPCDRADGINFAG